MRSVRGACFRVRLSAVCEGLPKEGEGPVAPPCCGSALQAAFTISWVDDWLAGLVHGAAAEPVERSRHERFIVARTVTTLAALASLPAYMLGRGAPTQVE